MSPLEFTLLFFAGVAVNTYAILVGGAMFLSIPLFQLVFPHAAVGQLIGTIKVGSLARGASAVAVTLRKVDLRDHVAEILIPLLVGTLVASYFISGISQLWVLPAVLMAIAVSENAKRLSKVFSRKLFQAFAVGTGLYGGAIGAGVITMIMALLRIKLPLDEDIAQVRIDANAIEFAMNVVAVLVLWGVGGLSGYVWVPWAAGSAVGGFLGGRLLNRMTTARTKYQRVLLIAVYVLAVAAALMPWVKGLS